MISLFDMVSTQETSKIIVINIFRQTNIYKNSHVRAITGGPAAVPACPLQLHTWMTGQQFCTLRIGYWRKKNDRLQKQSLHGDPEGPHHLLHNLGPGRRHHPRSPTPILLQAIASAPPMAQNSEKQWIVWTANPKDTKPILCVSSMRAASLCIIPRLPELIHSH
jgi:hypothetical protein